MNCADNLKDRFPHSTFDILSLEDEIRADQRCTDLLKAFAEALIRRGMEALEAGTLAHGADLFLRDFLIADRRDNIFRPPAERVRQFAGNWYIVRTLEPNMTDLERQLTGIAAFYRFFAEEGLVDAELAERLAHDCRDLPYYASRIEAFWDIADDGYRDWNAACPVRNADEPPA